MATIKRKIEKKDEPRLPGFFNDDDGAGIRPIKPANNNNATKKPTPKGKTKKK